MRTVDPAGGGDPASAVDPLRAPLSYPGRPPQRLAVLVTGIDVLEVQPLRVAALGQWPVRRGEPAAADLPLDRFLGNEAMAPVRQRTPVLSVGSNAAPAQVRRKMANAGLRTVVPITAVTAHGLAVGVSAHVSAPGYVPATPVWDQAAVSSLWVVWLDAGALTVMDATEPNYRRVRLPSANAVYLTPGQPVPGCWAYVSRHGYLVNRDGEARRLTDQDTLISGLLSEVPALMTLAGTTPAEWIQRTRDRRVRESIRGLFRSAGLVRQQAAP